MNFQKNDVIYKFRLMKKLGQGSFGSVWLATDTALESQVALKILPADFSKVVDTLEEARNGHKVNHRNLLQIYSADIVRIDSSNVMAVLIAQEYHERGTVETLLNARHFLPTPTLIKILKDVLLGLEYLHNGGIIHNDIKPGNILIDKQGNGILSDYGISGVINGECSTIAKNAYIPHQAPESRFNNEIDFQTDIYQLGCTAFRLANNVTEREFTSFQPYVPNTVVKIIKRSIDANRDIRYKTALEMRRDLEKCSFPGYWTVDNNDYLGIGNRYEYRFDIVPKAERKFDFNARKRNTQSGRETRILDFCLSNLSARQLESIKTKFFQWVINNAS